MINIQVPGEVIVLGVDEPSDEDECKGIDRFLWGHGFVMEEL